MNKLTLLVILIIIYCIQSETLLAHAEHDKARYVAPTGVDKGRCGQIESPCKTIGYAAQNANKGDNIRVASGNYQIDDSDTLFYLLSEILPIHGSYDTSDHFQKSDKKHITRLIGVPLEYAQKLAEKGFTVIVDQKGQNNKTMLKLRNKLDVYSRLQKSQKNIDCNDNTAGDFPCNNVDLLAHVSLNSFSTNPVDANDIWGHFDLNNRKEYALIGLSNGIGIVDVSNPATPTVITTIASQSTIWRDLKVYQYYDNTEKHWKSYAYVTADSASVGLMIIDLSDLPNSASVVSIDTTDLSAHNVYLSNVDYSTGVALTGLSPYLHIAGSNNNGGAFNSYSLANPTQLSNVFKPVDATRSNYSHDVSSMIITDSRKDSQCVNGTDHCQIFFDFNENNFQLWDKTVNTDPQRLSTTSYANANYVHSGWFTEDKLVVIVHDELDEISAGLNTTVRFFNMSNLTAPNQISTWTGPTRAIDHNGFVRGNRYYMSNYERGLTILDITDPTSPTEVGYFDTYPVNDSASFNGAWGVYPFLPSGTLLVSDINSGLYILKDRTLSSQNGNFSFDLSNYSVDEGGAVSITVARSEESQNDVQVSWELTTGSADENDFTLSSGILLWQDGETGTKTINVQTLTDGLAESEEMFFIRLFDPKNGATLTSPSIATITITAENLAPIVNVGEDFEAEVNSVVTLTGTVNDPDGDALNYLWLQTEGETVSLIDSDTPNAHFTATLSGSYRFTLTATDSSNNSSSDSILINVVSFNNPPEVTAQIEGGASSPTTGETVSMLASASDPDGDALTFNWQQLSGNNVAITNAETANATFTPSNVGDYSFKIAVTDSGGKTSSATVDVKVIASSNSNSDNGNSSGGGSSGVLLFLLLALRFVRQQSCKK